MTVLGGATLAEPAAEGRLERWRMNAVLAYADADRAGKLAPHWVKPIARQAEAARFLATQRAREGDEHGLSVMGSFSSVVFRNAADREKEPASKKQYEQLFRHMADVYSNAVGDAVGEAQRMRDVLASLEKKHGITTRQLQRAGFRMPLPRSDEEDRFALFRGSLHTVILSTPALRVKYMHNPVSQAKSAPQGATGEWWSMACASAGDSPDKQHWWAITVVDTTKVSIPKDSAEPRLHPWHNRLLYTSTVQSTTPPNAEESIAALLCAILLPIPGSGPTRRPHRICLALGLRHIHPALKELGEELDIKVSTDSQTQSLTAEVEHSTRRAAQNYNIAGDPDTGKGLAAKKKKKKKKK
jgi:hypothetical protein